MRTLTLLLALATIAAGCGEDAGAPADTAPADTGVTDTSPSDTGPEDDGVADTGAADTAVSDTGPVDTGVTDMGGDASSVPCTEPNSGIYAGHCYFLVATSSDWTSSPDKCTAMSVAGHPVHPVTITTTGEWTFVSSLTGGGSTPRWIGLSAPASSSSKAAFKWITGETSTLDEWRAGHPNGSGACVIQHAPSYTSPNQWEDVPCGNFGYYICERE